eukprot:scaffold319977_cov21-Tisochrysis_lutea.AAC.1
MPWSLPHPRMPVSPILDTFHLLLLLVAQGGVVFSKAVAPGGVIFSNAVVTVSPSYARDIVFAGAGGFLREVFNLPHVSSKFYGILNGVDVADWNPA